MITPIASTQLVTGRRARSRTIHSLIFVGSRRRTTKQANAAGFPSVAAWTEAIHGTPASIGTRYRETALATARRAVAIETQYDQPSEQLWDELVLEAESAIGEFIARRLARCPRLASQLIARFADALLPRSTWLALRRSVRVAIRERARRFARVAPLARPDAAAMKSINARIDALLAQVEERAVRHSHKPREVRSAAAHVALLEKSRAHFLAGHCE